MHQLEIGLGATRACGAMEYSAVSVFIRSNRFVSSGCRFIFSSGFGQLSPVASCNSTINFVSELHVSRVAKGSQVLFIFRPRVVHRRPSFRSALLFVASKNLFAPLDVHRRACLCFSVARHSFVER